MRAELAADRISIFVEDQLFVEYLFSTEKKYPYFFPVMTPRTGRSVTVHQTEPYPHHSPLFFGCDKMNRRNLGQRGRDRGQIVSKEVRLIECAGREIILEQDCVWERPGAPAPFEDQRIIRISAPRKYLQYIDFEVRLKALVLVLPINRAYARFFGRDLERVAKG